MKLLYLVPDGYPTFRPDISTLFGRMLGREGLRTDLATFSVKAEGASNADWSAGELLLCADAMGRAGRHVVSFLHLVRRSFGATRERYQAIQVRNMPVVAAFALAAARLRGLDFYYWMSYPVSEGQIDLAHSRRLAAGLLRYIFPLLRGHLGVWLLYRWILPRADHVFVQSEQMRRDLEAFGLPRERMTPVPMGVDMAAIRAVAERSASKQRSVDAGPLLGYLGTLDRTRRIELLFDALALVRQRHPGARLRLVGDAGDTAQIAALKRHAQEAGVADAVEWTGWVPTVEGWRLISECDVAFSLFPRGPLLDGASPTKVPEYLALGVPVVCNDNPDQVETLAACGAGKCVDLSGAGLASGAMEVLSWTPLERARRLSCGLQHVDATRDYVRIAADVACVYRRLLGAATPGAPA